MNNENDYIAELTPDEKRLFVECFCCMVYADGNVAKEEIEFLKGIGKIYGVEEKEIVLILKEMKKDAVLEKVKQLTDRKKTLQLVKELCYLANSDNNLGDAEIDFIIDVAEKLNVESDKIKQINKWVLDRILLQKTGEIILEIK